MLIIQRQQDWNEWHQHVIMGMPGDSAGGSIGDQDQGEKLPGLEIEIDLSPQFSVWHGVVIPPELEHDPKHEYRCKYGKAPCQPAWDDLLQVKCKGA